MSIRGKRIAVTGGLGAVGAAIANTLNRNGAVVTVIDRATPSDAVALSTIGGVDLTDPAAARDAIVQAANNMGGLDGLANVAGAFRWELVDGGDIATWNFLFDVNLKTALCTSQAALPFLKQNKGAIVNVAAYAALSAAKGMSAYAASKAAVAKLTESLADEMKPHGVRINAILPTTINTLQNRNDMPGADIGQWVSADAVSDVIEFLLSERSRALNGALIPVTNPACSTK